MADETAATEEQPQTDDAQPTGDATGNNGGNERTFSQADVNRMIDERLAREREKAERERKRADEVAEAKRLESQQEYQQLAEQRQSRIDELEPEATKAERYEAALKTHLDKEREGLPDYIIELLDTKDVADQLEYIAKNRDKLKPQQQRNGIEDTPRANGNNPSRDEQVEQEIIAQRSGRGRPY